MALFKQTLPPSKLSLVYINILVTGLRKLHFYKGESRTWTWRSPFIRNASLLDSSCVSTRVLWAAFLTVRNRVDVCSVAFWSDKTLPATVIELRVLRFLKTFEITKFYDSFFHARYFAMQNMQHSKRLWFISEISHQTRCVAFIWTRMRYSIIRLTTDFFSLYWNSNFLPSTFTLSAEISSCFALIRTMDFWHAAYVCCTFCCRQVTFCWTSSNVVSLFAWRTQSFGHSSPCHDGYTT